MEFGAQHGYYTDTQTGLSLLTHRYYDAGTGRFVTRDPIGYKGGINLYGFAGNNPVNESDPDGTSVLSFVLEQGAKKLTKGMLKNFLETQIKRKVEKVVIKQFAKRFGKEAFDASAQVDSILNDQWWEVGVGFIPVVGDAFDVVDEGIKIKRALSVLDKLQAKVQKILEIQGKTARVLVKPAFRSGPSWAEELADKSYAQIVELSQGSDALAKKASQMKKLIEQEHRLGETH